MLRQADSAAANATAEATIHTILVPSDGSALSERALPIATEIASAQGAEVVLARVVEPAAWIPGDIDSIGFPIDGPMYREAMEVARREAWEQLNQTVGRFQARQVAARSVILQGAPAAELLALETELAPDLLVMATHGRTGLQRLTWGSITDQLVREGVAPVLVVPSFGDEQAAVHRVIIPLDGSELARRALPLVSSLAGKPIQSVCLFGAVPRPEDEAAALSKLNRVAGQLPPSITQVDVVVREGDPAIGIVAAAEPGDLIVMATHGRGGLDRLWHGSVAERVLSRATVPTLLVRAGE